MLGMLINKGMGAEGGGPGGGRKEGTQRQLGNKPAKDAGGTLSAVVALAVRNFA